MLSLFLYTFLFPFRFLFRFGFLFLFLFTVPIPDSGFPLFQTPPKRKFSNYLQRSYPGECKRDRTNAFITISIEVSTTNGYGCSSC